MLIRDNACTVSTTNMSPKYNYNYCVCYCKHDSLLSSTIMVLSPLNSDSSVGEHFGTSDTFDSNMKHFYLDPNEVLNKNLHFHWQPLITCKPKVLVMHLLAFFVSVPSFFF